MASIGSSMKKSRSGLGSRDLEVVVARAEGRLVAVEADVPHPGGGNELGDALDHAEAGAENGNQGQLLALHLDARSFVSSGRLDLDWLGGEVAW